MPMSPDNPSAHAMPAAEADEGRLLAEAHRRCLAVREAVRREVVGQDEAVEAMLVTLLAGGHVLLLGVPGLAKTTLARALARALGWGFRRVQFTPDLMPADLLGIEVLRGGVGDTPAPAAAAPLATDAGVAHGSADGAFHFVPGPIFTHLLLADEVNRTPPRTQAALLEAMQERQVTTAGLTRPLPDPFMVLATQNPIEQAGTYPLPEAQLDRFFACVQLDYPAREHELRIAAGFGEPSDSPASVDPIDPARFAAYRRLVTRVPATEYVVERAVDLVRATRPQARDAPQVVQEHVRIGASPRAAQALVRACRARAVLEGRPAASADDLRVLAPMLLRHRLILRYQAQAAGLDADAIVNAVMDACWH